MLTERKKATVILATALYVKIDDMLKAWPGLAPTRPDGSIVPTLSDAGLLTLTVMSALLGGDVWVADSAPVPCGCSRETVTRSDAAGWAEYGYCASYSRYSWGLRLHLVCTLHGLPVMSALASAKAAEREIPRERCRSGERVARSGPDRDKNYFGHAFEEALAEREISLLRPARKGEAERAGQRFLKPLRQVIESVNWTLKDSLTWNSTAAVRQRASPCAYWRASSRSPRRSGTTTK